MRLTSVLIATMLVLTGCWDHKTNAAPTPMITTDGTFQAGTPGIPAGTWTTSGTAATGLCLWIHKADDQVGGAELGRGRVNTGQTATVTLTPGQYLTTMDCSAWEHVDK